MSRKRLFRQFFYYFGQQTIVATESAGPLDCVEQTLERTIDGEATTP